MVLREFGSIEDGVVATATLRTTQASLSLQPPIVSPSAPDPFLYLSPLPFLFLPSTG